MEEESTIVARLQKKTAYDVVIQRYDYLVKHVDAIGILPYLVSSKLVEPDFGQFLEGERTDKGKMMALLGKLIRNPMEGWFTEFIGALSKFPQYKTVVDCLLEGIQVSYVRTRTRPRARHRVKRTLLCVYRFHQADGGAAGQPTS